MPRVPRVDVAIGVAWAATVLGPALARAHAEDAAPDVLRADVILALAGAGAVYLVGWRRLRRRGPRAAPAWRLAVHLLGIVALVVALLSPLDAVAQQTLPAHMLQHLLLTMAAAPALVLAGALPIVSWALPIEGRLAFAAALRRLVRAGLARATSPPVAGAVMAATLWLWHVPAAYEAALARRWVHDLQHLTFFASALLFWVAIVDPAPRLQRRTDDVRHLVSLFAAIAQNGALAAWIALSSRVLYLTYASRPDALGEQQVAGVLMLGGGSMMYVIAALLVAARIMMRGEGRPDLAAVRAPAPPAQS
jgi:cytochrome c oxidase assembly factor CtaG